MTRILYMLVNWIYLVHEKIMTLNDAYESYFTDKELHFIVMGLVGMAIVLAIYPIFKLLSKHHVIVIVWFYVMTVMVVLTFAIEIGQGYTGTGTMEMEDVIAGLAGFLAMFAVFMIVRGVILAIWHLGRDLTGQDDDD